MPKFNISYVFADKPQELNTSIFRCAMPGKALAKQGYGVSLIPIQLFQENTDDAKKALEQAHVIVVERNFIGDALTYMAFWAVRGKIIIANFDDAYHCIEETNVSYPYWHDGMANFVENGENKSVQIYPHPMFQFQLGLKIAHAMTLPSKELMSYYGKFSPAYYVANYFETEHYVDKPKTKRNYITIGWGGSVSHLQSFKNSGVMQALKNVCEVRDNVKVLICGDDRIFKQIELPTEKKIFQPYVPHNEWGGIVARDFDIGIAPLAGEYDNYRSYIKPLEYMITQTPLVATIGPAYRDITEYGTFIENGEESWTKALLEKVDNLQQESELAKGKPYEFGISKDVNKNAEVIADTYREIALKHGFMNLYDQIPVEIPS